MADTMALIDRAVPVIIDADTGFGNALNAQRTMRSYERGAAAPQGKLPIPRCGHLKDKTLISARKWRAHPAMADAHQRTH